ncbi:MAG: hypothetical protein KGL42_06030 [Betaproteobacteria bacterium]|nr:hypothetical protein [Betaproteobacteria bacterium]
MLAAVILLDKRDDGAVHQSAVARLFSKAAALSKVRHDPFKMSAST